MADEQDWRLRADIADAHGVAALLDETRHLQRDLKPRIGADVVLSADEGTLFAYANTRAAIDRARGALEHQLADEDAHARIVVSHWDEPSRDWRQVDPPPDGARQEHERAEAEHEAEAERAARVQTRTVAFTAGRMIRNWFETTVADEARARGIELQIVEHPHLLSTQVAFTLTGPADKIDELLAVTQARAGAATRLETAYLAPI